MDRLTPREAMFYFLDDSGATTHLGALLILEPSEAGLDYRRLVALVENRLSLVPRYRQIVTEVTLGLARPVWVDDRDFDINFHIRRAALPGPGDVEQLDDLISRVMSRPLDRSRPLWEMYLIEGLADGRLAVLTKSHRVLVDDHEHLEISEVLAQETEDIEWLPEELWMPGSPPGASALLTGALAEALARPGDLLQSVVAGNSIIGELRSGAASTARRVGSLVGQFIDAAPDSPLNTSSTSTRGFTVAKVPRRECARIAERFECTVNDVVLAIITGALRRWKLSYSDSIAPEDTMRAVLPLSSRDPSMERDPESAGRSISVGRPGFVTDLPVGEDNPTVRLMQVAGLANRYAQSPRRLSMGLRPMFTELGMVPFAEFGARTFTNLDRRHYNVPISIGPSPVSIRFVDGHKVVQMYTIPTFIPHHALAIGVIEYGPDLAFTFIGDRGVIDDIAAFGVYVTEGFEELLATKAGGAT